MEGRREGEGDWVQVNETEIAGGGSGEEEKKLSSCESELPTRKETLKFPQGGGKGIRMGPGPKSRRV